MDVIIITSYNRPDYLRLCLEYLSRAEGIETKDLWICIDRGRALVREFYEVIKDFPKLNLNLEFRMPHTYQGNSYNTLEAYKTAYYSDAEFVYLVEDDVLVTPDFFKWHEAVQARGNFMCSVAYRCLRNAEADKSIDDPAAYFTTARDYASIGVCWRRKNLAPLAMHANTEYYDDMGGYLTKYFPGNRFADSFTEQDGLIMRILGDTNGLVCWPYLPRAFHIGFAGYNRPHGTRYTYQEIKEIIYDAAKVAAADRDFHDIEVVPTKAVPDWSPCDLYQIQHFE